MSKRKDTNNIDIYAQPVNKVVYNFEEIFRQVEADPIIANTVKKLLKNNYKKFEEFQTILTNKEIKKSLIAILAELADLITATQITQKQLAVFVDDLRKNKNITIDETSFINQVKEEIRKKTFLTRKATTPDPCEYCKSKLVNDVNYNDFIELGLMKRHRFCKCEIIKTFKF